jgi:hypothetical protein
MFHRQHDEKAAAIVAPRVRTVRLLETDEDLRAAIERAKAFERARMNRGGSLTYERYLQRPDGLAEIVHIETSEAVGA